MSENNSNSKLMLKKKKTFKHFENEDNSISIKDNTKETYDQLKYKIFKA